MTADRSGEQLRAIGESRTFSGRMWSAQRHRQAGQLHQSRGVRVSCAVFLAKAIISGCVGAVEFVSTPVVERSIWGTAWAFAPRWFGIVLLMWAGADYMWQSWLVWRMRRAWWYCIVSSACAVPAYVASAAMPYPRLVLFVSAAGAISVVFLVVFRRDFNAR